MNSITHNGKQHPIVDIREFRNQHNLDTSFSVAQFEPKDFTGLGVIDHAGAVMTDLRKALVQAVPDAIPLYQSLHEVDKLTQIFKTGLYGINERIGLQPVEVEFAISGFSDVLTSWAYKLIQTRGQSADFKDVYAKWLQESLRISQTAHMYQNWQIQIINDAYGRWGLRVQSENTVYYVQDMVYSCPAQGYMLTLLSEIASELQQNVVL